MSFWTQQILFNQSQVTINLLAAVTGSVDGTNPYFGFVKKPSFIVSDGASYQENSGWTWNSFSLTATMDVPPKYDIFAVA